MRAAVVLRLGLHPHGLHPGGHPRHLPLLHLHHRGSPEDRGLPGGQEDAQRQDGAGHRPLLPRVHRPPVLLLHGPAEGGRAVDQSFRGRRRGLRAELVDRQTRQGIFVNIYTKYV